MVIECHERNKEEAIALRVDQNRLYHRETPEQFAPQQHFSDTGLIRESLATYND